MKLHRLIIENFRGIKKLEWIPQGNLTCLIGPGDSTKTTILDALSLILTTKIGIKLCDADFFDGEINNPIRIEAVVVELSKDIISLDNLGDYVCGVAPDGSLKTDPEEGDDKALAIQFTADESLEPLWDVLKPNTPDITPRHLTVSLRAKLGVFRVDEDVNTHLRWGRGSALASITSGIAGATSTTVKAQRAARQAVFDSTDPTLVDAAKKVKDASNTFGATHFDDLRVGLDPQSLNTGYGLVLHDGPVPLTGNGLGTRRLTSLGIQEARTVNASIILIDEIETGLEPHRLFHLLRLLRKRSEEGVQVIMTTHAPLVVETFGSDGIAIVRKGIDSTVVVKPVPSHVTSLDADGMQQMIRSGPSAMLAKQIVILEGATEMGVFREFFEKWDEEQMQNSKEPLAVVGTAVRNGQGDAMSLTRARCLAELGFPVITLIDSDKPLTYEETMTRSTGAQVVRWGDGKCFEERIALDLPDEKLEEFIKAATQVKPEQDAVKDGIKAKLTGSITLSGTDPRQWATDNSLSLMDIRNAIGKAAHDKKWFKDEQKGVILGKLLYGLWADIQDKALGQRIAEIRAFAYPTQ